MRGILFTITVLFGLSAHAIPKAPFNALEVDVPVMGDLVDDYDFNGIVSLSNCSASLVRFSGQPDSSQAYVLTNGHCISPWGGGFLKPGEIVYNEPTSRGMNAFKHVNRRFRIQANTLVYATMTNTDAALYRVNSTYAELKEMGIEAFELSFQRPLMGQNLRIVSGYWKRGFTCHIDAFVYLLKEASWTFQDSIRYSESGCEVYGGTSGSPIIDAEERVVIGVNNTGNESGGTCTMNNPCEVDEDGNKTVIEGRGYGQQVYWFYSCLTEDFRIDLNRDGCELPN